MSWTWIQPIDDDYVDWFADEHQDAPAYISDPFLAHHLRMDEYRQRFPEYQVDPWKVAPHRAKQLAAMPYSDYLQTVEWQAKRRVLLRERGNQCERCPGLNRALHVHHKTYKRVGHELPEDLEVLCEQCHREEHGIAA